jgi:GTP cyclohydrolase I
MKKDRGTCNEMAARGVRELMHGLGYTIEGNPHLEGTPMRVAKALAEITTPVEFTFTTFPNDGMNEMVIVKNVPFYSLCAHHLLPFFGVAHVAYIPNKTLCGISKLARAVEFYAKGLCIQEEITDKVATMVETELSPKGVAVVLEAEHLCMTMRGVQKPGTKTVTAAMRGVFLDNGNLARQEFYSVIGNSRT